MVQLLNATWWTKGEQLGSPFAFDTETRLIQGGLDVPDLALIVANDGVRSVYVHPDDACDFFLAHKRHKLYAYNAAFDFWVMAKHLALSPASRVLWDAANEGRLTCLRLLWRLIRLALLGIPERHGTLADACLEFGVHPIPDKSDPYRLRYGELIGLSREQIDSHPEGEGFKAYAIADAVSTYNLISPMQLRAISAQLRYSQGQHKGAIDTWGPLTVELQTRADIVLDYLSREPLRIDTETLSRLTTDTRARLEALASSLAKSCPKLWKAYVRSGALKLNPKSGLPQCDQKALVSRLEEIAKESNKPLLMTEKGKPSVSAKDWSRHVNHPWVDDWNEYEGLKKRLSTMLLPMSEGAIYANYETLLRTGRTSAAKHRSLPSVPIQQVPRDNTYRKLFLADDGCQRLTIDYSYLELRTLAACCLAKFGESKLAEAVRAHTQATRAGIKGVADPHEVMGAAIMGITPDEFMRLPKDKRKDARQKAKPVNFGYPGGLGVSRFVEFAKISYGITLTKQEAKDLKRLWCETYPEMRQWLSDATIPNLCDSLECSPRDIRRKFGNDVWWIREAIEGYRDESIARQVIPKLYDVCGNKEVALTLHNFDYSEESHEALAERLLLGHAVTPTGRVRARVGYCDGANSPFQGLAADGAKEALWQLLYKGYRVKAFIHDEILVDLPWPSPAVISRIHDVMDRSMEAVMRNDVPCMSESHLAPTWVKG